MDDLTETFHSEMAFNAAGLAIAIASGVQAARRHAQDVATAEAIRRHNAAVIAAARTGAKVKNARAELAAMRELADLKARHRHK